MPIKVECTGCGSTLRVPDEMLGRKVRCPKCQETFTAAEPKSASPPPLPPREEVRDDPPPRPKARDYDDEEESRPSRSRSRSYDEEEDTSSSRSRSRSYDDDDDRPSRRRDDDDDRPSRRRDDYDDRPSRRRAFDDDDDHPRRWGGEGGEKPGSVQVAGILMLIGSIFALLYSLAWFAYEGMFAVLSGGPGCVCCLWPGPIYETVTGIMGLIKAINLMGDKAHRAKGAGGIAIMLIICIVNGDVIAMVMGIIAVVMLNNEESTRYFNPR